MNTTNALRHLVSTLNRMDLTDEQQRPTEEEYRLARLQADRALADFDEERRGFLALRDGSKVSVRAPWPMPGVQST